MIAVIKMSCNENSILDILAMHFDEIRIFDIEFSYAELKKSKPEAIIMIGDDTVKIDEIIVRISENCPFMPLFLLCENGKYVSEESDNLYILGEKDKKYFIKHYPKK